jgi:hypothetical protein
MWHLKSAAMLACLFVIGCMAQVAAQQPESSQPRVNPPTTNPAISVTLTCDEFRQLLHSNTSGFAILWLDGYYSARAGLTGMPAGWSRTISQGIGGTCAIDVNTSRPVLDVIAQIHREYGGVAR